MKIKRVGFTLAELLLCVGIIGIVTAMGMTAMKQTTENAYKKYWSAGYIALQDVLMDVGVYEDLNNPDTNNGKIYEPLLYIKEMNKAFGQDFMNEDNLKMTATTKNGITYSMHPLHEGMLIEMEVPQVKTRSNPTGRARTAFMWKTHASQNGRTNMLIPLPAAIMNNTNYTDLSNRVDLLPFYVVDGNAARNINGKRNLQQYSYRDAYTETRENTNDSTPIFYKPDVNEGSTSIQGILGNDAELSTTTNCNDNISSDCENFLKETNNTETELKCSCTGGNVNVPNDSDYNSNTETAWDQTNEKGDRYGCLIVPVGLKRGR